MPHIRHHRLNTVFIISLVLLDPRMVDHNAQGIVLTVVYNATLRLAQLLYMADGVIGPTVLVLEHVVAERKLAQEPAPIHRKFSIDSLR